MTKRADTKEPGQRRRRGGLRVPSDTVPRRPSDDAAAIAPGEDGPAVSVAYAYGEDDEAEVVRSDEDVVAEVAAAVDGDDELLSDDINDTQAFQMLPEDMIETGDEFDDEDVAEGDEADVPGSREALTSGDSVDIPFDDDDATVISEVPPDMQADMEARRAAAAAAAAAQEAADEEEADGDSDAEESAPAAAASATAEASPVGDDGDDDDEAAVVESPSELLKTAEVEIVRDEGEGAHRAAERGSGAAGGPSQRPRFVRASTMSLSDQDLEEVIDEASGRKGDVAEPATPGDSGELVSNELLEEVEGEESGREAVELSTDEVEEVEASDEDAPDQPDAAASAAEPPPPPPSPPSQGAPAPPAKPAAKPSAPPPAPAAEEEGAQKRDKRRRKAKPWFDELFDEDYLRTLPFLTPQATQLEANFVMESLGVDAGAQVLDVACGYGRHAMELAARGFHVVGLDYSLPLLLRGADEAQRRGLTINFVHGDMREMTFESQFDGAYCLFSSFGYFDDETNKKTAQHIARALKPGARFVVEVLNRDYLVADLPSRVWWEGDGCVVLEEVEFNYFSSRIVSNRSVVFDDGRQLEQEISMRSFSLHELGKLLHAAGFRVLEISGSMATRGRFFGAHSRDIVVVAERRQPKSESEEARD